MIQDDLRLALFNFKKANPETLDIGIILSIEFEQEIKANQRFNDLFGYSHKSGPTKLLGYKFKVSPQQNEPFRIVPLEELNQ